MEPVMTIQTPVARAVIETYLQCGPNRARDELLALFAPDATFEDPVGGEVLVGHDAIGGFFDAIMAADSIEMTLDENFVRVAGDSVAFGFTAKVTFGDMTTTVSPIDVFEFDDQGLIRSMRSYWSPDDMTIG